MVSSKGFNQVIARVLLLAFFGLGISYSYLRTEFIVTPLIFSLFLIVTIVELYWFLRKQEREWSRFLESVKLHDFARSYQNSSASKELKEAYHQITQAFENIKKEQQSEQIFLQTLIGHIPLGLACFDHEGENVFANGPFLKILGTQKGPNLIKIKAKWPLVSQSIASASTEEIIEYGNKKLLVKKERFIEEECEYLLVSLTDVVNTLEGYELENYQKLLSVLTHEIMNSSTPILSLVQVVNKKLIENNELKLLEKRDQQNVAKSLKAIEERTGGMLEFVQSYRKINRPIAPRISSETSKELLDQIISLKELQSASDINIEDRFKDHLMIDKALIMQVLVNLILNAQEATANMADGSVSIEVYENEHDVVIDIMDNGPGVKPDNLHKIFIPFFTTKETGSGVGLALSRKIIKAHGGQLRYLRTQEDLSCFRIVLPKSEEGAL